MQVEEPVPSGCSSRQSLWGVQRHYRTPHLWIVRDLCYDTDMYMLKSELLMSTGEILCAVEDFLTFI